MWVDEQTRAVIISLNLDNGNYNYYCVSQFLIEFTPGGTLIPTATNKILRLDIYEDSDLVRTNRLLIQCASPDSAESASLGASLNDCLIN